MAKTSLAPGFRFHPTDVELVLYYLKRKVMRKRLRFDIISEIDLYKFSPWELPDKAPMRSNDLQWYFFCPRDKKYSSGPRTNRSTYSGYWKTTGKDRAVIYNSRTCGMKKTLVFHAGKPPNGNRTDWVMYEFRLEDNALVDAGYQLDSYVLCKIFQKSGPGPRIGEQYGAPFNEQDWEDELASKYNSILPYSSNPLPASSSNIVCEPELQPPAIGGTEEDQLKTSPEPVPDPQSSVCGHSDSQSRVLLEPLDHTDVAALRGNISAIPDVPDDYISLEMLAAILNDYPNSGHSGSQLGSSSDGQSSSVNVEEIFDGLEDLGPFEGSDPDDPFSNFGNAYGNNAFDPSHFLELNDLCFLLKSDLSYLGFSNDTDSSGPPQSQSHSYSDNSYSLRRV